MLFELMQCATDPAPDDVRGDLVAGVLRHNRRRSFQRKAAVGVLAVVGAVGAISIDTSEPAFAVVQAPNGVVEVEVYPELDDVGDLQRALAEVGLEASIVNLRAHPSLVGVVEVTGHATEANGSMTFSEGRFVIEAEQVAGPVELLIYSDADGDNYQASPSLFSPGQELAGLHCAYSTEPLTTAEFEERAIEAGLPKLTWTTFGETDPDTLAIDYDESDDRPEGFVDGARLRNVDHVDVFVSADNDAPATEQILMHDGTHSTDYAECTPELAARWR